MIGHKLSHYKIIGRLGSGGMGVVYLAKDLKLGRLVALKVLPPDVVVDAERIRRFTLEARAASALNHPGIMTVYDISRDKGRHFIASEYIDGENLNQRQARAPLSFDETLDVVTQIAEALAAAHERGIVHLDIKLENIMLARCGRVKVIDFGLAMLADQKPLGLGVEDLARAESPDPDVLVGTVAYMSPEQLESDEPDARSDVWSLGVCLYELLARRQPFLKETLRETLDSILRGEAPPLGGDASSELGRVVHKALRRKRAERYQRMEEFLSDLRRAKLCRSPTINLRRPAVTRPGVAARLGQFLSSHRRLVVSSLVLFAVVATLWAFPAMSRVNAERGRAYLKQRTGDSLEKARSHCEQSAFLNPWHAPAYVCLAEVYALKEEYEGVPTRETLPIAEKYAREALRLDPKRAEAHAVLGFILTKMWRWEEAGREFRHASRLNQKYVRARHWYCVHLRNVGQYLEALNQITIARDDDPEDKMVRVNLIITLLTNGREEEAAKEADELLRLKPDFWGARSWQGFVRLAQGNTIVALADLEAGLQHSERSHTLLGNLGHGYARAGETEKALAILAELAQLYERRKATGQDLAKVLAGLGRYDEAFEWLEKDFAVGSGDLPQISWHPAFSPLRADPHFDDLLRRMGLEPRPEGGRQPLAQSAPGAGGKRETSVSAP